MSVFKNSLVNRRKVEREILISERRVESTVIALLSNSALVSTVSFGRCVFLHRSSHVFFNLDAVTRQMQNLLLSAVLYITL